MTRFKNLLFEDVSEENKEYYMSEGCTYFALALNNIFDYEILILTDQARMWDENFYMIPHVYCDNNHLQPIDVKGKRSFNDVLADFPEVEEPVTRETTRTQLIQNYLGPSKPFPEYDEDEVKRAEKIINENKKLYS